MRHDDDIAWPAPLAPLASGAGLRWHEAPREPPRGQVVRAEPGLRVERLTELARLGTHALDGRLVYELDALVRVELEGWPRDQVSLAALGLDPADALDGWVELTRDGTRFTLDLLDGHAALEPEP